ncbi:hypothetical protein [Halobacillus mangrovi]|uniref:Uncharacterized protein n=1 Tax=Halobacillus mangrovi TaxID=402384 RepID=A0A1W5ZTY1_9BACI|nr:hypothetical protein [Halobacillus mangrovi]ARI76721.1 hypothetical protein HM131_07625 [Halobacillus mangrovi]
MDREILHQSILSLKGKLNTGQIPYHPYEDHFTSHLDAVQMSEDGLVDESTISPTLKILLNKVNDI